MSRARYNEIADDIQKRINSGEFKSGRLPSMASLIPHYNTSWRTLSKTWQALVYRGTIKVVPGVGTFVASAMYIPKQRTHR